MEWRSGEVIQRANCNGHLPPEGEGIPGRGLHFKKVTLTVDTVGRMEKLQTQVSLGSRKDLSMLT